jgi:glutamine synthetase adenylyltransferase
MLPEMAKDLSTDQQYLDKIVSAVISGEFPEDLSNKSTEYLSNKPPGKLSHARWITRASRILRLYESTKEPSENLKTLATFVVKVYAPSWFLIKNKPSCKDGTRNLFNIIKASRYLPETLKKLKIPLFNDTTTLRILKAFYWRC